MTKQPKGDGIRTVYEVDGILVSNDGTAVDEDGYAVPLTRMSLEQLRAEAKARNISIPPDAKRQFMMKLVKVHPPASLPSAELAECQFWWT